MTTIRNVLVVLLLVTQAVCLCAQQSKRIEILKRLADKGSAASCYRLAELAKANKLAPDANTNAAEYLHYINKAVELGYPRAKLEVAVSFLTGTNLKNQQMAYPILDELVKLPISDDFSRKELITAYYWMGHCLEWSKGVPVNATRAMRYYQLASIDSTEARFALLRRYAREKDKEPVLDFLYMTFLADNTPATAEKVNQFLFRNKLMEQFADYLDRKSQAGDDMACIMLAENEWKGELFPLQRRLSMEHYDRSVKLGNHSAAMTLATIHSCLNFEKYKMEGVEAQINYGYNIRKDLVKAEKYARIAMQSPRLLNDAAILMVYITGEKIKAATGKKDEKLLAALREDMFYFLMLSEQYTKARELLNKESGAELHAKDIYLKAKEFKASMSHMNKGAKEHYRDRIRMSANAGYPLAVLEYYTQKEFAKGRVMDYPRMIKAALAFPQKDNPEWLWKLAQWHIADSPSKSYPKALEYINQSATLGGLDALEFLIQAYRRGDARFGIKADEAKATEYFNKLIRSDCNLKKIRYFREYLASLKSKKDKTKDDLIPLFRSIGRNPQADRIYSDLLYSGDKAFGIEKNVEHAMRMLHFAARGPFIRSAVDEIIRHYEQDINRSATQDELQLNQEMMKLYQTIR